MRKTEYYFSFECHLFPKSQSRAEQEGGTSFYRARKAAEFEFKITAKKGKLYQIARSKKFQDSILDLIKQEL